MYIRNEAISYIKPDMEYLNGKLKAGDIVITYNGILSQDFKTSDNVLTAIKKHAGRNYGCVSQYSWYEVSKNNKLVFKSERIDYVYNYFEKYLKSY